MEQLDSHWTDSHEMWYLRIFLKSVEKNITYFTWRPMYMYENIWLNSSQNEKYFRQSCWENQNTFNVLSIFPENRALYEITWKNTAEPGRPQMKIWHMRIVCWIPKATDANSEYAILNAFPLHQWWHDRVSLWRYAYISSLV